MTRDLLLQRLRGREQCRLVSSANWGHGTSLGMNSERSRTKIRNIVGLRTPPWGTPFGIGTEELTAPLWVTLVDRPLR
jgi:hypothetical protein